MLDRSAQRLKFSVLPLVGNRYVAWLPVGWLFLGLGVGRPRPRPGQTPSAAQGVDRRPPESAGTAVGLVIVAPTTVYSRQALECVLERREQIRAVLARYGATNPRLFGSVAQGTAGPDSDVDFLLDMEERPAGGSRLSRLAGIRFELEGLLGMPVDVAYEDLLKQELSAEMRAGVIAL